jgi:hypothetical protein
LTQVALDLDKSYAERFPGGVVTEKRIDSLVQKRYSHETPPSSLNAYKFVATSEVPIGRKRKRRKLFQLDFTEIVGILHSALIDKYSHSDVADLYCVKTSLVNTLISKSKRDEGYLESLKSKKVLKATHFEHVKD